MITYWIGSVNGVDSVMLYSLSLQYSSSDTIALNSIKSILYGTSLKNIHMATMLHKETSDHFYCPTKILNIISIKNTHLFLSFSLNYLSALAALCFFSSTSASYVRCPLASPSKPPLPPSTFYLSLPSLLISIIFLLSPLHSSHLLLSILLIGLISLQSLFEFFPFFHQHIQHLFSPITSN